MDAFWKRWTMQKYEFGTSFVCVCVCEDDEMLFWTMQM